MYPKETFSHMSIEVENYTIRSLEAFSNSNSCNLKMAAKKKFKKLTLSKKFENKKIILYFISVSV